MKKAGVTLQDIANRVGVSKATVSYLLSGGKGSVRISDATRERVMTAAREMGYRPNAVARALARRRTDTFALVMQFPAVFSAGSGFVSDMLRDILEMARAHDLDVLFHTKEFRDAEAEVGALTDGRADGALILRDFDDPLAAQLLDAGLPCVFVFARSVYAQIPSAACDDVAGGRLAGEHLLALGHRVIGFVCGSDASSAVRDRRNGLAAALDAAGESLRPENICPIYHTGGDFEPLLHRLRQPDPPTAVFVWSDDIAAELIVRLRRQGLRVPEDISVIGFDDAAGLCERSVPRLTSIRQPILEIARCAVEKLAARIRGEEVERLTLFSPTLVARDSCAPPKKGPSS